MQIVKNRSTRYIDLKDISTETTINIKYELFVIYGVLDDLILLLFPSGFKCTF